MHPCVSLIMVPDTRQSALLLCILLNAPALSGPPELDIITGTTISQFVDYDDWKPRPVLMLMDIENCDHAAWEASIWNDPKLIKFIQSQNLDVIWIDPEVETYYAKTLNPSQQPAARFGLTPGSSDFDRAAFDTNDTPESIIEWLSPAINGSSLIKELNHILAHNPDDIEARWKILEEFRRQSMHRYQRALSYQIIYKLIEMNEIWFIYMHQHEGMNESEFRATIIQIIEEYRTLYYLFGEPEEDGKRRFIRNGWQGAIEYAETEVLTFNYGKGVMHRIEAVRFRRTLEERRDNCIATDRDLFILKALTAEGEEWQQLKAQYQPSDH